MKANSKILLTIGLVVLVTGGVFASIKYNQRGIVDVQTGRVVRQDLVATVTASGEIKPKNYINLGANTMGPAPITEIMVKEGDRVRKGQVVARMRIRASQRGRGGAEREHRYVAGRFGCRRSRLKVAGRRRHHRAGHVGEERAELDRTKANFWTDPRKCTRKSCWPSRTYDQKKAEYDTAVAAMGEAEARLAQARAQGAQAWRSLTSAQKRIAQVQANLDRYKDMLDAVRRHRAAGWHGHQLAGSRGRDRGAGRAELGGQHHHDHRGHVGDHGRGERG